MNTAMKKLAPFFLMVALAAAFVYLVSKKPAGAAPGYYQAFPEFTLTDQNGKAVEKKDMLGSVWVADFIFTRCSGICPTMTSKMYRLQTEHAAAKFVSFSVDPEFDTPEVLKGYAEIAGAEAGRWSFLTGDAAVINGVSEGLHFSKLGEAADHTGYFTLVDRTGAVRGYYESNDAERMAELGSDIKKLLNQR